ncbi:MAG: alpha/beta fold hydrolase [Pseudorhodoplanes sp.]|nr:alpha/beta fold hydrolase [Pseudorhodoplanes sp.]
MTRLNHEIAGHGPHVVLLHPVGLDLTFLSPLADALKGDFTVLSVDQAGHGRSEMSRSASTIEDYADDLHGLLAGLSFAPAALVGFSFGGMVAQAFALKYPDDVSALVLSACPSTLPAQGREIARARGDDARKRGMADVLEATLDRWFTPPFRAAGKDAPARERLLTDNVEGWAQAWHAIGGLDTHPRLPCITAPTLCIAGEADKSSPPNIVKAIADAIPGARYAEIAGAPHMLFIEQPAQVARLAGDFLRAALRK